MTTANINDTTYSVTRFTVPVPDFSDFQERYEGAAPPLPLPEIEALVSRRAPWSEMLALIDASAPHGFLIYFRNQLQPLMSLAGDERLSDSSWNFDGGRCVMCH